MAAYQLMFRELDSNGVVRPEGLVEIADTEKILESVGRQDYFHVQSMQQIMRRPGARHWWERERKMFASTTVTAVDAILAAADASLAEGGTLEQDT